LFLGGEGLRISCQELGSWGGVPCLAYHDVVQVFHEKNAFFTFLIRRLGSGWKGNEACLLVCLLDYLRYSTEDAARSLATTRVSATFRLSGRGVARQPEGAVITGLYRLSRTKRYYPPPGLIHGGSNICHRLIPHITLLRARDYALTAFLIKQ
jgi:hypothetical protein